MAGMNSRIHLQIKTETLQKIKEKAYEEGISISEFCRRKLKENSQLDRIEEMLGKLEKEV